MFHLILSCSCFVLIAGGSGTLANDSSPGSGRIVGGSTALLGQFPFTVSLRTASLQNHFCGAFIITDRWLMTAAHCTSNRLPTAVIAVVGAISRTLDGTKIPILKFENHPHFNSTNLRDDIALLKTLQKIEFSPTVQPIRMSAEFAKDGSVATVSGWGYTTNPGHAASNLQWIRVKTIGNEECRKKMTKTNAAKIFNTTICAEAQDPGGACMGDSGGPMVSNGVIVGIVSWGVPCSMGFPDVYTRLDSYHSWIDSVIDF